jgi:hypothetical protein
MADVAVHAPNYDWLARLDVLEQEAGAGEADCRKASGQQRRAAAAEHKRDGHRSRTGQWGAGYHRMQCRTSHQTDADADAGNDMRSEHGSVGAIASGT